MKIMKVGIWMVLDVMLFFTLLFSSVQAIVYFDPYFEWHYEAHNIEASTGMSVEGLMDITDKMMDYLIDKRETLDMENIIEGEVREVFGEKEKAHMVDVKVLFLQGKQIRDISFIVLVLLIGYMFMARKKELLQWFKQLKVFFIASFIFSAALGLLFSTNFSKYFTKFHEIFFDNDLWLLDPNTDILINIVPEIFFFQTAMLIIILFTILVLVSLGLSSFVSKRIALSVK